MTLSFWLELGASFTTVMGILVGSTTLGGCAWYAASLVFWVWLAFHREMWGLMPLNGAVAVVTVLNAWRAW